jgi:hypothetical protein
MPTPTAPSNARSKVSKGAVRDTPPTVAQLAARLLPLRVLLVTKAAGGAVQVPELLRRLGLQAGDWYVRRDGWLVAWGMPEQLGAAVHRLLSSGRLVAKPCRLFALRVAGVCLPQEGFVHACLLTLPGVADGDEHERCGNARCRVCKLLWDAQGATQVAKPQPLYAEEAVAKARWARRNDDKVRRRRPEPRPQPRPAQATAGTWYRSKNGNPTRKVPGLGYVTVFEGRRGGEWYYVLDSKFSRGYRTRADALHAAEDAIALGDLA